MLRIYLNYNANLHIILMNNLFKRSLSVIISLFAIVIAFAVEEIVYRMFMWIFKLFRQIDILNLFHSNSPLSIFNDSLWSNFFAGGTFTVALCVLTIHRVFNADVLIFVGIGVHTLLGIYQLTTGDNFTFNALIVVPSMLGSFVSLYFFWKGKL